MPQVELSSARRTEQHRKAASRAIAKIKAARMPEGVSSDIEAGIGAGNGMKEKANARKSSARSRALVTASPQDDSQ